MSGGPFTKAARPKRPGVYTNFDSTTTATIPAAAGTIVALPIVHDWGPFQTATYCNSYAEFIAAYGSNDTAGGRAVKQAFQGEGLSGRYGAGAVIVYRFGASTAAKAFKVLQNSTPVNAVKLRARYKGTKGNDLRVTKQDYAADATKDQLLIYNGTVKVEEFVYTDADVAALITDINANSDWIEAVGPGITDDSSLAQTGVVTGVALGAVSSQAFASGANGDPAAQADWTAMLDAIGVQRFGIFVPYALTNANVTEGASGVTAVLTAIKAWAVGTSTSPGLNLTGRRCLVVVGGEAAESVSTAASRAATFNDPNVVNFGVGTYNDEALLDSATNLPRTLSTAELAPRLAGIFAAKGETQSATFARLAGLSIVSGPTEAQILQAFDGGTVVLARDSNQTAPVRIEKALTTYTTTTNTAVPYLIYRNPKFVLTMHGLETELQEYAEANVIGQLPVNGKTRQLLVGEMGVRLRNRVDLGVVQANPTVGIDTDPPPSDDDEFIALVYGIAFGRSIEQVFNTLRIG